MFKLGSQKSLTGETRQLRGCAVAEIRHNRHRQITVGIPVMNQQNAFHSAESDTADELIACLRFDGQAL